MKITVSFTEMEKINMFRQLREVGVSEKDINEAMEESNHKHEFIASNMNMTCDKNMIEMNLSEVLVLSIMSKYTAVINAVKAVYMMIVSMFGDINMIIGEPIYKKDGVEIDSMGNPVNKDNENHSDHNTSGAPVAPDMK